MSPSHALAPPGAPLIEIRGPWLLNKGDALMLDAVVAALGDRFALAAEGGLGLARLPRGAGVERLAWGAVEAARLSKGWMTRTRRAQALRDGRDALALPRRARRAPCGCDARIEEVSGAIVSTPSGFAYGRTS